MSRAHRPLILAALWAILLLLTAPSTQRQPASPPPALRVMTYNILFPAAKHPAGPWPARRPVAVALIRRWQPDVVGLQEPTPAQVEQLVAELPEYAAAP